jgi:hypothetical protein
MSYLGEQLRYSVLSNEKIIASFWITLRDASFPLGSDTDPFRSLEHALISPRGIYSQLVREMVYESVGLFGEPLQEDDSGQ